MIPRKLPRIVTPNFLYWLANIEPKCRPFIMTSLKANLYRIDFDVGKHKFNTFGLIDPEGLTLNFSSVRQCMVSLSLDGKPVVLRPGKLVANYTPLYAMGFQAIVKLSDIKHAETVMLDFIAKMNSAFHHGRLSQYFYDPSQGIPEDVEDEHFVPCSPFIGQVKHEKKGSPSVDPHTFPIYFTLPFAMWAVYHRRLNIESAYHALHHCYTPNNSRVIYASYGLRGLPHMDDNLLRLQDVIDQPECLAMQMQDGKVMMDFGTRTKQKIYTLFYDRKKVPANISPAMQNEIMINYVLQHEIDHGS